MYNKNYLLPAFLFLVAVPLQAAVPAAAVNSTLMDWILQNIILLMGVAAIFGAFFSLYNVTKIMWRSQRVAHFEGKGMSAVAALTQVKRESFLNYVYTELAGGVPIEKESDVLLNHDYDGIQELDNNLPPWWVGMFYGTIIFSFVYIFVYHFSDFGLNQADEYKKEVKDTDRAIAVFMSERAEKAKEDKVVLIDKDNVTALTDAESIGAGQKLYTEFCVQCHGAEGQGGIGPNLTDDYWVSGGGIANIFEVIYYGKIEKGMIAWKDQIKPEDIQKVASFVMTLHGTNPEKAKAPQGEIWEESKEKLEEKIEEAPTESQQMGMK